MESNNVAFVFSNDVKRAEYRHLYEKLEYALARARTAFKHAELEDLISASYSVIECAQDMRDWENNQRSEGRN